MNNENKEPKKSASQPRRKQRLHLPFDGRKQDFTAWTYDHRIGLIITVIIYLTLSIAFVTSKIVTKVSSGEDIIYIDMSEMELEKRQEEKPVEKVREEKKIDWEKVRNLSSNENVLNEKIKDTKGTDVEKLNAEAEAAERDRIANREAYEQGLREVEAIGKGAKRGKEGDSDDESDVKHKGSVTVSFSLANPTRYSRYLVKPAYRCEGGGEVVVAIVVNQSGEVISATVESGGDGCMRSVAVESARNSRFDVNTSAPARQQGTITYIFIPQ